MFGHKEIKVKNTSWRAAYTSLDINGIGYVTYMGTMTDAYSFLLE